jgi:phosphoribosylglycinamide formyltransferase-1
VKPLRVAVLISGRGSNLAALIEACHEKDYPAEIVLTISNRPEAPGLAHAEAAGITRMVVAAESPEMFAAEAEAALARHRVGLVCLAGFMRLLDAGFVERWRDHMVNIHPSLLPSFRGLHAQRQALAAGVRFSGCTVHFVRSEVDTGPIIAQAAVPVCPGDDESSLSDRILAAEHKLYPLALRLIAEGRVRVTAGRAEIVGWAAPRTTLWNPLDKLVSRAGSAIPASGADGDRG